MVRALRAEGGARECLLVGAMARDIQLAFQHGIPVTRATKDLDFAVAVPDWPTFLLIREALLASGQFQVRGKALHALTFMASTPVDLIPFGGVLRSDQTIAWPPDQDPVMTLLAYPEAWKTSLMVQLPEGEAIQVISIPAVAILQLVAWRERRLTTRGKDAEDLWLLLRNYLEAGQMDRLYEEGMHLFEQPDFDLDRAGAWLLGKDAGQVLDLGNNPQATRQVLRQILEPEADPDGALRLVSDMVSIRVGFGLELIAAFLDGLHGKPKP